MIHLHLVIFICYVLHLSSDLIQYNVVTILETSILF